MNIPRVPQLPQQFVCEAPAFVLSYIQDVMAWGNMGWDKAREKDTRVAEFERLISDDAFAITFQTLGQYRSALLKALRG